jgi:hypothetical protein
MLKLLLDEHISPDVAEGLRRRLKGVSVVAMAEWETGQFMGQEDAICLREAANQGFTLVTYDRRTIPPVLKAWAEAGQPFGGVVFVDEKTISPADFGGLIHALGELFGEAASWDWTNRVYFLRR